jgi:hypothetical protein
MFGPVKEPTITIGSCLKNSDFFVFTKLITVHYKTPLLLEHHSVADILVTLT